ncbi:MAG: acyl-CoA thioesterase [Lentisphaeria bacterium]|nr:acyl-CoA thioesterase [Lentisphaeria bacterium]
MRRRKTYFQTESGAPQPLELSIRHRLHFSEVDALSIAWHGHYLKFFELAHTELMRRIGLSYQRYKEEMIGAPVAQAHVDYHKPLMLDQEFTVTARLFWNEGARLNTEYEITQLDGTIAATGYTVQMLIDMNSREPFLTPPPILANMQEHWKNGEIIL